MTLGQPKNCHRPYYKTAVHYGAAPMVRGERYMTYPVIPVGQGSLREVHSIPSHTSGQSSPSNPKTEGLTWHIKDHGQRQRIPPKEKGDNQTSKAAKRKQRVTLVSQQKWMERKGRSFNHACMKVDRGETLHNERHP